MAKFNQEFLHKLLANYFNSEVVNLVMDKESNHYGACTFNLNKLKFLYRIAKITPTKLGQFVTVWKRAENGITMPHSLTDALDYYVIAAQKDSLMGFFIFPAQIMYAKGIIADQDGVGGKRGFRVYPVWDKPDNKQAIKTQEWQAHYFLDCSNITLDNEDDNTNINQLIKRFM